MLSLGTGAAGIAATFTTENGTGTGALIAAGLILGLVSATGRLPERGSIAGVDYDLGERVVERALDELPAPQRKQVAEIAMQEAESNPALRPALAAAAARRLWRHAAEEAVQRCAPEDAVVELEAEVGTSKYDALVHNDQATVIVEFAHTPRPKGGGLDTLGTTLSLLRLRNPRALTITAAQQARGRSGVVLWRGHEDDHALAAALAQGLEPPTVPS